MKKTNFLVLTKNASSLKTTPTASAAAAPPMPSTAATLNRPFRSSAAPLRPNRHRSTPGDGGRGISDDNRRSTVVATPAASPIPIAVVPRPASSPSDEEAPQRRHDRRQSGYHAAVSHVSDGTAGPATPATDTDAAPVQLQMAGGSFALEVFGVGRRRRVVVQERVQTLRRGQGVRL